MDRGQLNAALAVTAASTVLLHLKQFATNLTLGHRRIKAATRAPEDARGLGLERLGLLAAKSKFVRTATESVDPLLEKAVASEQRWVRIVANDNENLPAAHVLAWATVVALLFLEQSCAQQGAALTAAKSRALTGAHIAGVVLVCAGRVAHTLCYAYALQPWRTVAFLAAVVGMLVNAGTLLAVVAEVYEHG